MIDDLFTRGIEFRLNWNGAKLTGDELNSGKLVRVEAVGSDWVVLRTEEFKPLAVTFDRVADAHTLRYE